MLLDRPPPHDARLDSPAPPPPPPPSELAAVVGACGARVIELPPLQLAAVPDPSRAGALLPAAPSAADLRTLQLLSYFGALPAATHLLPGGAEGYLEPAWQRALCAFAARPPCAVPRSAVLVCAMHVAIDGAEALRALNASLVGLGVLAPPLPAEGVDGAVPAEEAAAAGGDGREAPSPARMLARPPVCECVGYAVVRCVDPARGLLYLVTPEPPERLAGVNVLLRGAIELPLAMLLPTALTAASPYLTTEALKGAGAAAQRSRNNILRQAQLPA